MDIKQTLKELGLHSSESRIYLYLLENGVSTPPQIARGTGIARTNCYHVLRELEEKQLVQSQLVRKRKTYLARDPESLVTSIDKKREAAQRALPELRELYTTQKNKPKIRFYNGLEEVHEIYRQTLTAEKLIAIVDGEKFFSTLGKFGDWYIKELHRRKIIFDDIFTASSQGKSAERVKELRGALHAIKFLPPRCKDAPTDILIWGDNVALITLEKPVFGTIITSESISQTFKTLFYFIWEEL